MVPNASTVAVLINPTSVSAERQIGDVQTAVGAIWG
jgi:hypothetical protein